MATEPLESFLTAYLSIVEKEKYDMSILFALAQWTPGAEMPVTLHQKWQWAWLKQIWLNQIKGENGYTQTRLFFMGQKGENIWRVAEFALLRQMLEKGDVDQLRCLALEAWRAGMEKATQTYCELQSLVGSRFHDLWGYLSTGVVPDLEYVLPESTQHILPEPTPTEYPRLLLPPGHFTNREWRVKNEELKMEKAGNVENAEATWKAGSPPILNGLSRQGLRIVI